MSLTVPALLTPSAGAPFERGTVELRELGELASDLGEPPALLRERHEVRRPGELVAV